MILSILTEGIACLDAGRFAIYWQANLQAFCRSGDLFLLRHSGPFSWYVAYSLFAKLHNNWWLSSGKRMVVKRQKT